MLEQIVQKFRGVGLLLVVFALSAVFALQFGGPQSQGCGGGAQTSPAAEVYGRSISRNEFKSALTLVGADRFPPDVAKQQKVYDLVLYGLIERNLLAREARALGFGIDEEEVLARVAEDGIIHLSVSIDAPGRYLPPSGPQRFDFSDSDGRFDPDNLKKFIQYRLRRSVRDFALDQIEETLAQRMRETIVANVQISDDEAYRAWVREQESATLKYARFSPVYFKQQVDRSEEAIAAFMQAEAKAVDEEYEKNKQRYTGLDKQVRARHILVKVDSAASDEDKARAKEQADALLQRAKAGEDFAALASEHSQDTGSAKKGGDLGYNPKGRMVTAFDEAQFSMEVGQISDLVETNFGFHIIKVEAIREGDVPVEEAKRELAVKLYEQKQAAKLAQQAAKAAVEKLKGGMELESLQAELTGQPESADGEAADAVDPLAPQFRDTRPFGRGDSPISGPFDSTPLAQAGFELSEESPLCDAPMQLGDDFFVYRLESKTLADAEQFTDEERLRLRNGLRGRKQREALANYIHDLMDKARDAQAVLVDESVLATEDNG